MDRTAAGLRLYWRFVQRYLAPYRWSLLACMLLVCANGSAIYLLAFYGRYVLDHILVVRLADKAPTAPASAADAAVPGASDTTKPTEPPAEGLAQRLEGGRPDHGPPPGAGRRLLLLFGFYMATILLLNYAVRVANRKQIIVGQNVCAQLRNDLHDKVLQLSLSYHKRNTPGRLLARMMSDVEIVQEYMMLTSMMFVQNVAAVILGAVILLASDWRMAIIAVTATPLYALVYKRSRQPLRELSRELRHTNSCMYGLISQKMDAIKAIQAYGQGGRERLDFRRLGSCFLRDALGQQRLSAGVAQISTVIAALGSTSIFLLGTHLVLKGEMSLGKMMYIYGVSACLFAPVLALARVGVLFNSLMIVLHRLVEILDEPVEIQEADEAQPFPTPLKQGIALRHVQFSYDPEAEAVLKEISMDAAAGKWVCVMGASGCGKTTLLYLLARLYEPLAGRLEVDGMPLDQVGLASLRDRVALVPQEAQIFRGTIRDNISYGHPEATPKQIVAAAKAAELHNLIMEMPAQYEALVGEKGISLSGGQRQRLSLARALLTNPDVLLLDDCTSALDAATEQRIQQTLSHILEGKTAVIVSQRVSMAMRCHRIYVMTNGVITEAGTHAELVGSGGFYSRLHAQQTE